MRALAEHLHAGTPGTARSTSGGSPMIGDDHLEERARQRRAQRVGTIEREQPSLVQQRDAGAALRLVEIRRRHHDRDALRQKLRQQLPELAPRHRIDAGRRLVEHDQRRLVDERAGERQLLLHAARQPIGEPRRETA